MSESYSKLEIDLKLQNTDKETRLMFQHILKEIDEHFNRISIETRQDIKLLELNIRWIQVVGGALFAVALTLLGQVLSRGH